MPRVELIANLSYLNSDDWEPVLQRLIHQGWVKDKAGVFYLRVDLNALRIGDLSELIHERRLDKLAVYLTDSDWFEQLNPLFVDIRDKKKSILDVSISSVINK